MANIRYQLLKDCYMPLDGQWQIVQCGTVFDDIDTRAYSPTTVRVLVETPGALAPHGKPAPVRNVRTR